MSDEARRLPMAPTATPVFDKIAVVGLGLIGGSITLAARQLWPSSLVIGVDEKPVLETAMRLHAIDVAADDLVVLAEADLVILAAPVRQNIAIMDSLGAHIRQPAVITDVGSTKRATIAASRDLPARLRFVGGHPLAGAPRRGIEHARPDLFAGRPWLLTPTGDGDGDVVERLSMFVSRLGAVPRVMEAGDHDTLMAALNQVPQLTVSALMHVVGERAQARGLALAGRGLLDATKLAATPAAVWRDICATNADEIGDVLDALIAHLQDMRRDLTSGEVVTRVFESANEWRAQLESARASEPTER